MADRCPTNVYYEFHGMGAEVCPYPCQNKTEYGYCKTTGCINPKFDRTRTFTWYDPIEIARQYAPKFDKPVVDMVEVVRCKDCKWWDNHDGGERCINTVGLSWAKPENFCNYGERKDELLLELNKAVTTQIKAVVSAQPIEAVLRSRIDLQELEDRFGKYVKFVVEDMMSGEGKRWEND